MKNSMKGISALLFAAVISFGLGACGTGNEGTVEFSGENPLMSAAVSVKTGTISTDSWGYTGSSPIQVTAPAKTEIVIKEHTLLTDVAQTVVSGAINTRISFSSDKTTLTESAQTSAPANFLSYVNILMESAKSSFPAVSVTVDVVNVLPGETLTAYNYDAGTGMWISAQTAVVNSSGKITFPASRLSLWGIFR